MFHLRLGVALLAAVLAAAAATTAQQPAFRSGTQIVPVYVTVTDAEKRLVPGLVQEDFEILDNGIVQPISFFENQVQPVTVTMMIDTSASMSLNLDFVLAGAEQFILRLLPQDKGRVGHFNDKVKFVGDFTSNRDSLVRDLKDLDFGNPTRLYDALSLSLEELQGIEGRRVALVFTDGDDTASRTGLGEIVNRARADEVMVYAIGMESEFFNGQRRVRTRPDSGLKRLAEETGGGFFELKKKDELGPTFTRVAQELHTQYVLGFTPPALDGKVHKLDVRIKKPGMSARARKSYLAGTNPPADTSKK
jgi:Ca-activated chloride channel family protein